MFKKADVLFLYAETSVHLGSGQSLGAIDLAIQRERYTDYPVGAAAGIKGAARDWFERKYKVSHPRKDHPKVIAAFGPEENASEHAGAVAFTDARILLFPVRSMKGVFAWITCPFVLERFKRDLAVAGETVDWDAPSPTEREVVGANDEHACKTTEGKVLLEEYVYTYDNREQVGQIAEWIGRHAFPQPPPLEDPPQPPDEYKFWRDRLISNLLVLHDNAFHDFVRYSTEVQARIKLNEQKTTTGGGGNLFYQENLPCDTLFYTLVLAQDDLRPRNNNQTRFSAQELLDFTREVNNKRLQIGGDESVGKGIVFASFVPNGASPQNSEQQAGSQQQSTMGESGTQTQGESS